MFKMLLKKISNKRICIVGLGYVGLPLAVEFAKKFKVIGFDINKKRISELKQHFDSNKEISRKRIYKSKIKFTSDSSTIKYTNVVIITVPTPLKKNKQPDLSHIRESSKIIGKNLKKGSIVIYESTVYPGVTEEICKPILENYSGLKCPKDFKIGYSPERTNPGDKVHTIDKIIKIVSGIDSETLENIAKIYSTIIKAGVFKASSIRVAEAAKVIENTQRDLNIALMNELSIIFKRMGIKTADVIKAASTKWNFHRYRPGLVGGHCISVDPHYLLYSAKKVGYNPKVILAGREVNDYMPKHVVKLLLEHMDNIKKKYSKINVLIMGLTFKENIKDTRNTRTDDIIKLLKNHKISVSCYEPFLSQKEVEQKFNIKNLDPLKCSEKYDAFIISVPHDQFRKIRLIDLKKISKKNPIIIDVPRIFNEKKALDGNFAYYSL